jgi:hypothetical protein
MFALAAFSGGSYISTSNVAPRSKRRSILVLFISIMIVAVTIAGCSSPTTTNKALRPTKGAAFNEQKVMVFQPPT